MADRQLESAEDVQRLIDNQSLLPKEVWAALRQLRNMLKSNKHPETEEHYPNARERQEIEDRVQGRSTQNTDEKGRPVTYWGGNPTKASSPLPKNHTSE